MSHKGKLLQRGKGSIFVFLIGLLVLISGNAYFAQEIPRFRLKEERARDFFQKGLAFHNTGKYAVAQEFLYKALTVTPYFHLARRYLGDSYYYSGDWNSALEQWEFLEQLAGGAYPLIQQRSDLLRFHLNQYRQPSPLLYLRAYGPETWNAHRFLNPADLAVDTDNNLYILSYKSADILKVNSAGEVVRHITGPIQNRLKGPLAMTLYQDLLYVCDYAGDQVRVLSTNGAQKNIFGGPGNANGLFHGPSGIAVTDEAIYVADTGNRRIQKFDPNGVFLLAFGEDDRGNRPLHPAALAISPAGEIFLADSSGRRILRYDTYGNFLGSIRSDLLKKPRGLEFVGNSMIVSDETAGVLFYNFEEQKWSRLEGLRDDEDRPVDFFQAFATRADKRGSLYVSDYAAHRVSIFTPQGLRVNNLDARIQRIVTTNYPEMAVFMTIKDKQGVSVAGLPRSEVVVYENDRRAAAIKTDNMEIFNNHVNIVLVKENSVFFRDNYEKFLAAILKGLLDPLRVLDQLELVRVGSQVRPVLEGLRRREILQTLTSGETTTKPNLSKGLFEGVTRLQGSLGPRHVILIASGKFYPDAFNQYGLQKIIQYARAHEITIDVISFEGEESAEGKARTHELYRLLTEQTGGTYYPAFNETKLKGVYAAIQENSDRRYIISYCSPGSNDCDPWWIKLLLWRFGAPNPSKRYVEVRVEIRHFGTFGIANGGYFVP